jgi:hypothetical protein
VKPSIVDRANGGCSDRAKLPGIRVWTIAEADREDVPFNETGAGLRHIDRERASERERHTNGESRRSGERVSV